MRAQALVARGTPVRVLVRLADRERDVVVVGTGRQTRLHRAFWPSVGRHCLAHAGCPVLAAPPSPLQAAWADQLIELAAEQGDFTGLRRPAEPGQHDGRRGPRRTRRRMTCAAPPASSPSTPRCASP
ncbi:universal stress protein [Streptomyces sp. NPDC001107]